MNKKDQIFLFLGTVFWGFGADARYVRHISMFVQEEVVHGTEFSHTIKSDKGKSEELFFVNTIPVQKVDFYQELESAQVAELRKERERADRQKKNRISFADQAQVAIIEKLIKKRLQESVKVLDLLQHEQLKRYFVFQPNTIDSLQKLIDIKGFVSQTADQELKKLVEAHDLKSLQEMLDRIDPWPDRLETFFQASVQNAIKNSDDTAMLKELLALLSQ